MSSLVGVVVAVLLLGAAPSMPLEQVVQLPPQIAGARADGNAAWLEEIDPTLGTWVTGAAAVRPQEQPRFETGVVLAHGVRFESAARARRAWEAIRSAGAGDGRRYDVEGFGEVHAHRDPLIGGVALTDYHRLVGTDIYVLSVRVDGPEEVPEVARDVLAWHVEHTGGPEGIHPAVVMVAALAGVTVIAFGAVQVWRRR